MQGLQPALHLTEEDIATLVGDGGLRVYVCVRAFLNSHPDFSG